MHPFSVVLVVAFALLLAGCDGTGPDDAASEPNVSMTLSAPVNASVEGTAAFADGSSFEDQTLLVFPLPQFGQTLTAIQLFGETADGATHDLSFMYIADDMLAPDTYDVNSFLSPCADLSAGCSPGQLFAGSLFTAQYTRQTTDSLFTYGLDAGSVTIDHVSEEVVRGTFDVSAAVEVAVARADLSAYIDSLRARPPQSAPSGDFPPPPPSDFRMLSEPLTVTGTFTATPGEVSDWLSRFGWMMGGAF